ncbi:MAG: hypothetical protein II007_01890 [Gammaproteobacteria bacterium]|nr:hypothetical protein [Gammaproteobacteria bacterium]
MAEIHGDVTVNAEGRLLLVVAHGAFNLEGTLRAYAAIEAAAAPLLAAPWVKVTDFRDCMLGGPECLELISRHNQWCITHNCQAMALVVENAVVRDIYRARTAASGLPLTIHTSLDEARQQVLTLLL